MRAIKPKIVIKKAIPILNPLLNYKPVSQETLKAVKKSQEKAATIKKLIIKNIKH